MFVQLWLTGLKHQSQLPAHVSRELVLWFCVSWVFSDADVFASVTSTAVQQRQGRLPTLDPPIPEIIIGKEARESESIW